MKLRAIIILLLLLPTASAQSVGACLPPNVCVTDEERHEDGASLSSVSAISWAWTVQPGFFNFTAITPPNYANGSLVGVYIKGDQYQRIDDTTVYEWIISLRDNATTHILRAVVTYQRYQWFGSWNFFPHGNAYYSFQYDGTELAPSQRGGFSWNENPTPSFIFGMDLRPTTANKTQFQNANETTDAGNTYLGNAVAVVEITDVYGGSKRTSSEFSSDAFSNVIGFLTSNAGTIEVPLTNFTQFGAMPGLQMATNRPTERQVLSWQFTSYRSRLDQIAAEETGGTVACSFGIDFGLFSFCISDLLSGIFTFIGKIVIAPIDIVLGFIPGLGGLREFLANIVATVFGYFSMVTTIIFSNGPNYPNGGILIAFLMLITSIAFPIWGLTGSISYIWRFPYYFLKGLIKGTAIFAKFIFFDIPITVYQMFAGMIP